ncbi:MAG: hypothetical protein NT154_34820 [Verrucomicrobia bacterium]|nr:hypothetical protein [Verrucomicrobiota bacterium]
MDQATHNKIVSFIWGIADDVLRDLFKRGRYPDVTPADAKYLASLLASPIGQRQMESLLTVGNRQGLNYQQLGSFVIPWPEEDERKAISSQIHAIEGHICAEEQEQEKLALLKSGLMTDLLTGRVRVSELDPITPKL